jgi:phosphatidylserine/phosphatidylglycerophosphate/cardiolipin synthase-like enzyme
VRSAALLIILALLSAACSPAPGAACGPPQVVFSRAGGPPPSALLIKTLDGAKSRIDAAVYAITHPAVVEALIRARERGLPVRLITDAEQTKNPSQAAVMNRLKAAGVRVKVNTHPGLMHLKAAVIDGRTAAFGSYNWTTAADRQNDEVLAVYECQEAARAFEAEFERLWSAPDFADYP